MNTYIEPREWLYKLRRKNKMTQKEISASLDISRQSYSALENCTRQQNLKQDTMEKLANIFGITVTEIIHLENKRKNKKA